MPLEHEMAELLTGYMFFLHPSDPCLGILRLDTLGQPVWVQVNRPGLLALAAACTKHAAELQEVQ
jgi:hypothetical protein